MIIGAPAITIESLMDLGRLPSRDHLPNLNTSYDLFRQQMAERTPDNPALYGAKYYSQNDEDGVIEHILGLIGIEAGTFVEIGCGDGTENMTAYLCLKGWSGTWVDASSVHICGIRKQAADFEVEASRYERPRRVAVLERFVRPETAASTVKHGLNAIAASDVDFLSVDIDGDDLECAKAILEHYRPSAICLEYNAILGPHSEFVFRTDGTYRWQQDDYMGCSLRAIANGLAGYGYHLVACNLTGSNAFFVADRHRSLFSNYSLEQLYVPARYEELPFHYMRAGHRRTLKNQLACVRLVFPDD
ncbi:MAG: hypothetical protein AAFX39_04065 [Pseudomonadota bacterium]